MKFEDTDNCFIKFHESQERTRSYKMDKALVTDLDFGLVSDLSFEEKNLTSALQVY